MIAGVLDPRLLAGVAIFLIAESVPAITRRLDRPPGGKSLISYIAPLAFGTAAGRRDRLLIAIPLRLGRAVHHHFAPNRLAQPLGYIVDLLAAIPSIIYGLWGVSVLGPASVSVEAWLGDHLGWIPFFEGPASATGRTMLVAGLVLAVMILPIITAVAARSSPRRRGGSRRRALSLGATRWEMIRMTVLPFGKSAMISGSMLGLGRRSARRWRSRSSSPSPASSRST